MKGIYSNGWNLGLYGLNAIMLVVAVIINLSFALITMGIIFLLWDFGYVFTRTSFEERTYDHVLAAIRRCRDYMGWYLIFYGIVFAALLGSKDISNLTELFTNAGISPILLFVPFCMVSTGVLFVPAKMTPLIDETNEANPNEPSLSLKLVFASTAFLQQYSTFMVAACIGKIIYSL